MAGSAASQTVAIAAALLLLGYAVLALRRDGSRLVHDAHTDRLTGLRSRVALEHDLGGRLDGSRPC